MIMLLSPVEVRDCLIGTGTDAVVCETGQLGTDLCGETLER